MEVTLTDGRTLSAREDAAPGGFDIPYDAAVLADKFRRLAGGTLPRELVEALADACAGLAELPRIDALTALLR